MEQAAENLVLHAREVLLKRRQNKGGTIGIASSSSSKRRDLCGAGCMVAADRISLPLQLLVTSRTCQAVVDLSTDEKEPSTGLQSKREGSPDPRAGQPEIGTTRNSTAGSGVDHSEELKVPQQHQRQYSSPPSHSTPTPRLSAAVCSTWLLMEASCAFTLADEVDVQRMKVLADPAVDEDEDIDDDDDDDANDPYALRHQSWHWKRSQGAGGLRSSFQRQQRRMLFTADRVHDVWLQLSQAMVTLHDVSKAWMAKQEKRMLLQVPTTGAGTAAVSPYSSPVFTSRDVGTAWYRTSTGGGGDGSVPYYQLHHVLDSVLERLSAGKDEASPPFFTQLHQQHSTSYGTVIEERLMQTVPYLPPENYHRIRTTISAGEQDVAADSASPLLLHLLFSYDVEVGGLWNAAVLSLEAALAGFQLHDHSHLSSSFLDFHAGHTHSPPPLAPREVDHGDADQEEEDDEDEDAAAAVSSLFHEIAVRVSRCTGRPLAAGHNFLYATLYILSKVLIPVLQSSPPPPPQPAPAAAGSRRGKRGHRHRNNNSSNVKMSSTALFHQRLQTILKDKEVKACSPASPSPARLAIDWLLYWHQLFPPPPSVPADSDTTAATSSSSGGYLTVYFNAKIAVWLQSLCQFALLWAPEERQRAFQRFQHPEVNDGGTAGQTGEWREEGQPQKKEASSSVRATIQQCLAALRSPSACIPTSLHTAKVAATRGSHVAVSSHHVARSYMASRKTRYEGAYQEEEDPVVVVWRRLQTVFSEQQELKLASSPPSSPAGEARGVGSSRCVGTHQLSANQQWAAWLRVVLAWAAAGWSESIKTTSPTSAAAEEEGCEASADSQSFDTKAALRRVCWWNGGQQLLGKRRRMTSPTSSFSPSGAAAAVDDDDDDGRDGVSGHHHYNGTDGCDSNYYCLPLLLIHRVLDEWEEVQRSGKEEQGSQGNEPHHPSSGSGSIPHSAPSPSANACSHQPPAQRHSCLQSVLLHKQIKAEMDGGNHSALSSAVRSVIEGWRSPTPQEEAVVRAVLWQLRLFPHHPLTINATTPEDAILSLRTSVLKLIGGSELVEGQQQQQQTLPQSLLLPNWCSSIRLGIWSVLLELPAEAEQEETYEAMGLALEHIIEAGQCETTAGGVLHHGSSSSPSPPGSPSHSRFSYAYLYYLIQQQDRVLMVDLPRCCRSNPSLEVEGVQEVFRCVLHRLIASRYIGAQQRQHHHRHHHQQSPPANMVYTTVYYQGLDSVLAVLYLLVGNQQLQQEPLLYVLLDRIVYLFVSYDLQAENSVEIPDEEPSNVSAGGSHSRRTSGSLTSCPPLQHKQQQQQQQQRPHHTCSPLLRQHASFSPSPPPLSFFSAELGAAAAQHMRHVRISMSDQLSRLVAVVMYCDPLLATCLFQPFLNEGSAAAAALGIPNHAGHGGDDNPVAVAAATAFTECLRPDMFAIPWFLTLFAHTLPYAQTLQLWDFLFFYSLPAVPRRGGRLPQSDAAWYPHCLLCICAALVLEVRSELLRAKHFSEQLPVVFSAPTSVAMPRWLQRASELMDIVPITVALQPYGEGLGSLLQGLVSTPPPSGLRHGEDSQAASTSTTTTTVGPLLWKCRSSQAPVEPPSLMCVLATGIVPFISPEELAEGLGALFTPSCSYASHSSGIHMSGLCIVDCTAAGDEKEHEAEARREEDGVDCPPPQLPQPKRRLMCGAALPAGLMVEDVCLEISELLRCEACWAVGASSSTSEQQQQRPPPHLVLLLDSQPNDVNLWLEVLRRLQAQYQVKHCSLVAGGAEALYAVAPHLFCVV